VLAAGVVLHASVVWFSGGPGDWPAMVLPFLAVLGGLAAAGPFKLRGTIWVLVRGLMALAAVAMVTETGGNGSQVLTYWYFALALVYPLALPAVAGRLVPPFAAVVAFVEPRVGDAVVPIAVGVARSLSVLATGAAAYVLGSLVFHLRGEREKVQGRLQQAEAILRSAFDTASGGMALLEFEGDFAEVNRALCDFLGRSQEELLALKWTQLMHPDDVERQLSTVKRLVDREIWSEQTDCRFVLPDGHVVWGLVGMSVIDDPVGRPQYLFVSVANTTERVYAEARLRRSEAHFRNLFEVSPVALWDIDMSGVAKMFARWRDLGVVNLSSHLTDFPEQMQQALKAVRVRRINEAARELFRVASSEDFARGVQTGKLGPGYREALTAQLDALWRGEKRHEVMATIGDFAGGEHTGIVRLVDLSDDGEPELTSAVTSFFDLTEYRRTRADLRRIEDRLRTVMGGAPIILFAVDENGVFTLHEGQGLSGLGLSPGEAVGRSAFELYRDAPPAVQHMRRALAGEAFTSVEEIRGHTYETRYSPVWESGNVTGVIGVAYDVTERENATDRLRQLIKSKDQFVATVSHELRTPLTAVVGFAQELCDGFDSLDRDELRSFAALIHDQSIEVGDLVEDLLVASRIESDGVKIVNEALDYWEQIDAVLMARSLGKRVRIDRSIGDAKVYGDSIRVRQVIRNLITNADRYGGPNIVVRMERTEDDYALTVRDDGPGIPEVDRPKIFEPYYRAHERRSTVDSVGLGLTVSRQLARLMGGDLTYDYRGGESVFTFSLPAV
jgi:PAS domain S-box-containing protein